MKNKQRAVFFDRDGVILKPVIENEKPRPPYSIAEYKEKSGLIPFARETVEQIKTLGFLAILISNQPDIRYGKISKKEWQWIQDQLKDIPFDDVFFCFHGREDNCDCKKPKPGLLFAAAKKRNIDLNRSFMVGDTEADIGAAKNAGCKTILLNYSYNKEVIADMRVSHVSDITSFLI